MSVFDPTAAQPPVWSTDDEWLQCVQVRDETHDVRTFTMRARGQRIFRFRPGQYMTYALPIDGQTVYRCYTIASAPTRPDTVSITVKRTPGGIASNWLHDHFKPGMAISTMGPAGEFSCFDRAALAGQSTRPMLFLSGGSGITPLMSMARTLNDLGDPVDLVFLHAARTPADIIFADEIALIARELPGFQPSLVCDARGPVRGWAGMLGRVNLSMLQSLAPDFALRDIYCCGPAPFMSAVRDLLGVAGYDMSRYHEESFDFSRLAPDAGDDAVPAAIPDTASTPPTLAPPGNAPLTAPGPVTGPANPANPANAASPPTADRTQGPADVDPALAAPVITYTVTFSRRGESFPCTDHQTVLAAAVAAGLRVPFSCAQGICGTCRTLRTSGEVEMNAQGGLRPREIRQGWFLPCCSMPRSDLVLDR